MADNAQIPYVDDIIVLAVKVIGNVGSNSRTTRKVLEDPNTQRHLQKALYKDAHHREPRRVHRACVEQLRTGRYRRRGPRRPRSSRPRCSMR